MDCIVAELSANHNGSLQNAKDTMYMAKEAGADAFKLQTYTPDTITINSDKSYFQINQGTIWDGTTLYKLYQRAYTPYEWHEELFDYAKQIGITIFSTPFDKTAVELLEKLNTPFYKIASYEINDIPLIRLCAKTKKPIIMATGVACIEDISKAVNTCRSEGNNDITLLKCTSEYPTAYEEVNLKTMANMKETFGVKVGISDHTESNAVSIAAVALGAEMIERHVILDKSIGGPDASFSLDKAAFTALVRDVRAVEKALGTVTYELTEKQKKSREHSRSLFVVKDMKKGQTITEEFVRSIRPAFGMHTEYLDDIIGKKVNCDLEKGTPMEWRFIE